MFSTSAGAPVNCPSLMNVAMSRPGDGSDRDYAFLFVQALQQACAAGSWQPFAAVTKTGSVRSAAIYNALAAAFGVGKPYPQTGNDSGQRSVNAYNAIMSANGGEPVSGAAFNNAVLAGTTPGAGPERTLPDGTVVGPGNFVRRRGPAPDRAPQPAPAPQNFGPTDQFGNPVVGAPTAERPIVSYRSQPPPQEPFIGTVITTLGGIVGGSGSGPCYAAVLPTTASYAELRNASGERDAAFGLCDPKLNNGANWAYDDGQGWHIETCKKILGSQIDKGARDVPAQGQVVMQYLAGGQRPNLPVPTGPAGPVVGVPGAGPLAACGGTPPMQTVRRTCGPGLVLAYDGMCYPKRLLPAALRMNKSTKAKVTKRDWDTVRKAKRVQRIVERMDADIESLYKRPARRRRRTTTTRKK